MMNFLKESIKILLYSVGYFALIVIVVTILLHFSYARSLISMLMVPGAWEYFALQILGVMFVISYTVVQQRKFRKVASELNATNDPVEQSKILSQNAELIEEAKTINLYGKGEAAAMQTKEGRYIYTHMAVISVVTAIAVSLHGHISLSDTQLGIYAFFVIAHLILMFIQAIQTFKSGTRSLAWILLFEVFMFSFLYLIVVGLIS